MLLFHAAQTLPRLFRLFGLHTRLLDARDPQVIENLGVTCRVWGYVKYHHPVFADSTLNVDYELFGLLPQVAKATPAKRNKVLSEWVKGPDGSAPTRRNTTKP